MSPRLVNVNELHEQSLTLLDRAALVITSSVGSMYCAFVFTVLALIALPAALDGGPLLIVQWISQTFLQLVLLSVIMVGQNLQGRHSEFRAENDYQTNVLAETEIKTMLTHLIKQAETLEEQNKMLYDILRHVEHPE